ncbi:MAG TPA: hypothetical protein VF471_05635 [Pseudoxanthomonas sp.]
MNPSVVIPAKAGIHFDLALDLVLDPAAESRATTKAKSKWIPAFAGMTNVVGSCDA